MKKILALTVALTAITGLTICFAGGERYSSKEVQPLAPECEWTGWYIGGHVGYGGGTTSWRDSRDLDDVEDSFKTDGIFGGGQFGYNRQINNWFVLGFEITGAYSGIDNEVSRGKDFDSSDSPTEVDTTRNEMDWMFTGAVRAGFLGMNNKALFYGKFGAALTHWNYDFFHDETIEEERPEFDRWGGDEIRVSPMIGLGVEYSINCHWSAKVEYNHLFIGDQDNIGILREDFEADETSFGWRIKSTIDTVQLGFNYHF